MTRNLRLAKETLTDLSTDELARVAGGAPPTFYKCVTGPLVTLPLDACTDTLVSRPTEG